MYKHGKPKRKINLKPLLLILASVFLVLGTGYYFFVVKPGSRSSLSNNDQPLISNLKDQQSSTLVDEPFFQLSLPGEWKVSARNWDARYRATQWDFQDKRYAGRWFRVYVDTIPRDQAYNYLLPLTAMGNHIETGQISENCINFTENASTDQNRPRYTPLSQAILPSRWQQVSFLCDNANVAHQAIGTGSVEAINTITLTGPTKGGHKYFFMYRDNNISPDLSLFETILSSFNAK